MFVSAGHISQSHITDHWVVVSLGTMPAGIPDPLSHSGQGHIVQAHTMYTNILHIASNSNSNEIIHRRTLIGPGGNVRKSRQWQSCGHLRT